MTSRLRVITSETGLTMVEMMASVLVFAVITLGITPLLISSVRGAALSRSFTVGKNLAVQAVERLRGLPYSISYSTQNEAVDVLDLYFPHIGAGYDGTNKTFTTTCTSSTPASRQCPGSLPQGYEVTYEAAFVNPSADSTENYVPESPALNYAWNSVGNDLPPTRLVKMDVTVAWTIGATPRTYTLSTLLGDRKVGEDRISGNAKVDHTVQVLTSFQNLSLNSDLSFELGESESTIRTRLLSEADMTANGGLVRLTRPAADASTDAQLLDSLTVAETTLHAPIDQNLLTGDSVGSDTITHPDFGGAFVAGVSDTFTKLPLKAGVANELPNTAGSFATNNSNSLFDGWVNVQATIGSDTTLKLNASGLSSSQTPARPVLHLKKSGKILSGGTSSATGQMGAVDRRVQTSATAEFGRLSLFPVTFIGSGNPEDRTVIQIDGFTANVDCTSTDSASSASATATYSATLRYWAEDAENDGVAGGSYRTVSLSGANTTDLLAPINAAEGSNPMVWEDPLTIGRSPLDIYLFPIHHDHTLLDHDHPGYLDPTAGWRSLFNTQASNTSERADGRVTEARIPGAISLTTVPLDPSIPQSSLSVSVGDLSCEASDFR